jgi:HK97 gp10 family phage protein
MSVTLKLEGFAEFDQALEELSKAAGKSVLRRALKSSAQPMADLMSSLAPVGATGDLAASVIVGSKLNKRQAKLHRKMFRNDKASVEMFVGPSSGRDDAARYGFLEEFGTVHARAQPFARPAWDQEKMPTLDRLKVNLWAELDKAMARAKRRAARIAARG